MTLSLSIRDERGDGVLVHDNVHIGLHSQSVEKEIDYVEVRLKLSEHILILSLTVLRQTIEGVEYWGADAFETGGRSVELVFVGVKCDGVVEYTIDIRLRWQVSWSRKEFHAEHTLNSSRSQ